MRSHPMRDEYGMSTIELLAALPIMLTLAFCILDAALMVVTNAEAHWAATAAARELCANPDAPDWQLQSTASAAAPAASVSVTKATGADTATRYTHHLERGDRQSTATTREVTVTATASRPTITGIGMLMEGSDEHIASYSVSVNIDRTRGSTW